MLRASLDLCLDAELLQLAAERRRNLFDQGLPLAASGLDQARDLAVRTRVERLEREVLELPLHLLHAEAIGERRVDLERLGGDPALLVGLVRGDRAHVVQAVGELDQQHADVAGHRHDHLADVLGLFLLAALEFDAIQFRETVDDPRDLLAEVVLDRLKRDIRVLDGVVQQRRDQRRRVQVQIRKHGRHGDWVFDELLAGDPLLALVRRFGDAVGALDLLEVGLRVVLADRLQQRLDARRAAPHRRGAGARAIRHDVVRP